MYYIPNKFFIESAANSTGFTHEVSVGIPGYVCSTVICTCDCTCNRVQRKSSQFTACHSDKLKLAFTIPDDISTSPKDFLTSRIDFTVFLFFQFLTKHHLPVGQVKNRIHQPGNKIHQPWAIEHHFLCTLCKQNKQFNYQHEIQYITACFTMVLEQLLMLSSCTCMQQMRLSQTASMHSTLYSDHKCILDSGFGFKKLFIYCYYFYNILGFVCNRKDLSASGCCHSGGESTRRYECTDCQSNNCCSIYEHCVSCCLSPDNVSSKK